MKESVRGHGFGKQIGNDELDFKCHLSGVLLIQCKVNDFQVSSRPGKMKSRKGICGTEKVKGSKRKLSFLYKFSARP